MLDGSTLAMPFLASLALVVVPGPAVLDIITRGVDQGRIAGFTSAWSTRGSTCSLARC